MKKILMLLIASIVLIPCFVFGGDIIVNNTSSIYNQCNQEQSDTYWIYLTTSRTYYPYDNFRNSSADSYITLHEGSRVGTSIDVYRRNSSALTKCSDWKRTSSAVHQNQTKMIIENQDGCQFNIPSYTKTNSPSAIDVQLHYRIGFVQFNYGNHHITDHLFYTTHNGNIYCFNNSTTPVSNGSNCASTTISYSQEYFHNGECLNYKLFWCGDGLVNSETGTTYNNVTYVEECDPNDPNHVGWNNNGKTCNPTTCKLENITPDPYCGDGILQSNEQCDPGNGNFGNGCNENCQLTVPNCTLTLNPTQGNAPLTTTINATKPSWAIYTNLTFGDGQSQSNPTFALQHTYNTVGTFNLTLTVKNNYNGAHNGSRPTATCSANVTTTAAPYCGDGILQSNEQCDPGNGNFGNGCNENCQLTVPNCTLTLNPTQGNAPLTTTINATKPSWAIYTNLTFGDGQSQSNPTFALQHTYNTVGTFNLTLTVKNNYNGAHNGSRPTATCSASLSTSQAPYCGDGILQSNEQCDPGSNNFGNGCDSSCHLMTPSCTLTVDPNQGAKPLTTTINGTKPNWAVYKSLSYGDNSASTTNPTFPRTHTYNQIGTFNLTLTVQNNYNGQINGTKPTATCNASVTVTNPAPQCGNGTLEEGEQCDPGSNNFGNGCSNNCQLTVPNCTLTVSPNQGAKPLTTTINGTKPNWAVYKSLSYGDNSASTTNPTFPRTHTYNQIGTFNLTLTVQNNYNGQINGTKPTATCNASVTVTPPAPQCGNGTLEEGEQCDPGSNNFGNGCSNNCQLTVPNCTLTVSPNQGAKPLTTTINGTKPNWAVYKSLSYGDNSASTTNPTFPRTHTYNQIGTFNLTLTVQNNYNGQINGTKPTATCNANVTVTNPQIPHLTIQKELLTAGNLTAGSTVAYKITLTNDGNATYYNAYILDIIPAAIQYQTSSIQNISNYQFTQGATGVNEYFVKYYNFNLNAGRSAVVYLTGKLRDGFMFEETTNCAFTSGDFDCELLPSSPKPYIKKYQKLGVDTNPNSAGWTTDILTVDLGDDISYRVDFGNVGNTGAYGMVKDILPECVQYVNAYLVDASGYGPIHYESTHTVQFSNIYLAPGQMAHMMVVGKIKQQDGCDGVFSYLNTGAFKFTFDSKWQSSTVLAVRDDAPGTTDVSITKDVDKYYVKKDDIVTYTITYTNGGSTTLTNYTIVDYWPSELDFMGVITPTSPVPSQNGNTITWVFENQNFVPGETREIKIKGRVR